mgnify:CR=1 FL=1
MSQIALLECHFYLSLRSSLAPSQLLILIEVWVELLLLELSMHIFLLICSFLPSMARRLGLALSQPLNMHLLSDSLVALKLLLLCHRLFNLNTSNPRLTKSAHLCFVIKRNSNILDSNAIQQLHHLVQLFWSFFIQKLTGHHKILIVFALLNDQVADFLDTWILQILDPIKEVRWHLITRGVERIFNYFFLH